MRQEARAIAGVASSSARAQVVGESGHTPHLLRTYRGGSLRAAPGTIAAPPVIGELDHLEYLEIGLAEWRTLLEADAVPSSLLAASVYGYGLPRADVDHVYDELIRRWGGNPLTTQTIEGMLTA